MGYVAIKGGGRAIAGAEAVVEGMRYIDTLGIISLQEMHAMLAA